jgi:aminoglycoside 3-N-acetyltransferase
LSEESVIKGHNTPVTRPQLADDLRKLGLKAGDSVLVHSSLSRLGWVVGGAHTVVLALLDVLTDDGTLMVPTHSASNSDPALWQNPPVPESWWPIIRAEMPAYDPAVSPTRGMGQIADTVRTWRGALRSDHPQMSFAAVGLNATALVGNPTPLADGLGDESPLGKLYDQDGKVLLLGVPYDNNTSLHLAESRANWPSKTVEKQGAAVLIDGERSWQNWEQLAWHEEDFNALGRAFEAAHPEAVTVGKVGRSESRLMQQRVLVDFAAAWMSENRT